MNDNIQMIELLNDIEQVGTVLDIIRYSKEEEGSELERFHLHQKFVVRFMKDQKKKADDIAEMQSTKDIPKEKFWRLKIYSEKPSAQKISWNEFLGSKELNGSCHGLYSAFMDPPHGLRVNRDQAESLYGRLIQLLVPSFSHPIEIYSWETDWSNYFDSGKEWWGAKLWTILTEYGDSITVIGASTTD